MLFEMLCHNNSWRMYSNSHIHTQKKKQVNEIATHHNDHRMWNKKIIQSHRTSPPQKKVERLKNVACSCLCAVVKKKSFLSFLLLALLALALLLLFFSSVWPQRQLSWQLFSWRRPPSSSWQPQPSPLFSLQRQPSSFQRRPSSWRQRQPSFCRRPPSSSWQRQPSALFFFSAAAFFFSAAAFFLAAEAALFLSAASFFFLAASAFATFFFSALAAFACLFFSLLLRRMYFLGVVFADEVPSDEPPLTIVVHFFFFPLPVQTTTSTFSSTFFAVVFALWSPSFLAAGVVFPLPEP